MKKTKGRIMMNLFEQEKENDHKLVREGNFWSSIYIEYKTNRDINKTLSIEDYLKKIRSYFKDRNDRKNSDFYKIQWIIAISFMPSKDNDGECVMYSRSDNKKLWLMVKQIKLQITFFDHFFPDIKLSYKHQWKVISLYLTVLIYWIMS